MRGWRVWRAFEASEGRDNTELYRALAEACRDPATGRIDGPEYNSWLEVIVMNSHLRAQA